MNNGSNNENHDMKKTIAGLAGLVLETYDFTVFGLLADILGVVFFPTQAGHWATAESFAIFGAAFFVRPLGGCIIGAIGDKYSRKRSLEIAILLMACPSLALGLLPSYGKAGWISPVLLTVVRLGQGFAFGGNLTSSLVFTVESRPLNRWGFYSSLSFVSASTGSVLGSLVSFALRAALSHDQLQGWGWRLPFLAGSLVCLPGAYLRFCCDEEEDEEERLTRVQREDTSPFKDAIHRNNLRALLSGFLIVFGYSIVYYVGFVWMAVFMETLLDPPIQHGAAINAVANFVGLILFGPISGIVADYFGTRAPMYVSGVLLVIMSPLLVHIISLGDAIEALLAQTLLGIFFSLWCSPMFALLMEMFPCNIRLTAISISYNLALAFGGGLSPFVATVLVQQIGEKSPGYYASVAMAFSLIGLMLAPEASRLEDDIETDISQHPSSEDLEVDASRERDGIAALASPLLQA